MLDKFIKKIKTELDDEFDRNFERQGFFSQKWKKSNTKGTTLIKSGALRKSIHSQINGNTITYTSSVPYANIHNNGGKIRVTEKMKRFFWYKFKSTKDPFYRAMALKKVGSYITIPQRQFIGWHDDLKPNIERVAKNTIEEEMNKIFKK